MDGVRRLRASPAACAVALAAAVAVAATPADAGAATVATDPPGDARGATDGVGDIRRVAVASAPDGMLRVAVTLAAPTPAGAVTVDVRAGGALHRIRGRLMRRVAGAGPRGVVGRVGVRQRGRGLAFAVRTAPFAGARTVAVRVRTARAGRPVDAAPGRGAIAHRLAEAAPARALRGPARISPGGAAVLVAVGFPPRRRLTVFAVPTRHRGDEGVGVTVPRAFRTDPQGRVRMRFAMPAAVQRCDDDGCRPQRWRAGEPVDVDACTTAPGEGLVCARVVVRVAPPRARS